jgi:hypothetical protein
MSVRQSTSLPQPHPDFSINSPGRNSKRPRTALSFTLFPQTRSRASCSPNRRPALPEPCQATSHVFVNLLVNTAPLTAQTTMILQHPRQKLSGISAPVGAWEMTCASLLARMKLTHHSLLLSRCIRRTIVPTVSIRDLELFPMLSKTVSQAATTSTPKLSLTLPFQILATLGRNSSSNPTPYLPKRP